MTAPVAAAGAYRRDRRIDLSRRTDRAAVVAIVVAVLLALLIWSPDIGGRAPGDPGAVAGDARLLRCGGTVADMEYAFTIPHAREYERYLPAMGHFTELGLDAAALVVVYRGAFPGTIATTSPKPAANARNLCIYVGVSGEGELNYYSNVSIAGLRALPDGPVLVPAVRT